MNIQPTTGIELEVMAIDLEGTPVNAQKYALDRLGPGYDAECSHAVVEVVSTPHQSLEDLEREMREKLVSLDDVLSQKGWMFTPMSFASEHPSSMTFNLRNRYEATDAFREATNIRGIYFNGLHVNTGIVGGPADTFNVLTAADPSAAINSTSPVLRGQNHMHAHRVLSYRKSSLSDDPLTRRFWELLPYVSSDDQLTERQEEMFDYFITKVQSKGVEVSPDDFTPDNTYWGPNRFRGNRFEDRAPDSSPLNLVMAKAALNKGLAIAAAENLVRFEDNKPLYKANAINLPSFERLKHMEYLHPRTGLSSPEVRGYVAELVNLSQNALSPEERRYLKPYHTAVLTGMTLADQMQNFIMSNGWEVDGIVSDEGSRALHIYTNNVMYDQLGLR